jgi:hypothetical protein
MAADVAPVSTERRVISVIDSLPLVEIFAEQALGRRFGGQWASSQSSQAQSLTP